MPEDNSMVAAGGLGSKLLLTAFDVTVLSDLPALCSTTRIHFVISDEMAPIESSQVAFGGALHGIVSRWGMGHMLRTHGRAQHERLLSCRYDLARFSPVNAVAFDHPDPSIFTVLTVPSAQPGATSALSCRVPPACPSPLCIIRRCSQAATTRPT